MAHSLRVGDSAKIGSTLFIYDSDYGDKIEIDNAEGGHIIVPFEHLLTFVAKYARDRKIARLEAMSAEEILGICEE